MILSKTGHPAKMRYVWLTFCVALSAIIGLAEPSSNDEALVEWEKLVKVTIQKLRAKRSAPETEHSIPDLRGHYTEAFEEMNQLTAAFQEDGFPDMAEPVRSRYIVMLQRHATDEHLDDIIRVLERDSKESEGLLVAQDFKPFRVVGKGFTATLGPRVADLVSVCVCVVRVTIAQVYNLIAMPRILYL